MPIFELQTPNGETYEIEAPTLESVLVGPAKADESGQQRHGALSCQWLK